MPTRTPRHPFRPATVARPPVRATLTAIVRDAGHAARVSAALQEIATTHPEQLDVDALRGTGDEQVLVALAERWGPVAAGVPVVSAALRQTTTLFVAQALLFAERSGHWWTPALDAVDHTGIWQTASSAEIGHGPHQRLAATPRDIPTARDRVLELTPWLASGLSTAEWGLLRTMRSLTLWRHILAVARSIPTEIQAAAFKAAALRTALARNPWLSDAERGAMASVALTPLVEGARNPHTTPRPRATTIQIQLPRPEPLWASGRLSPYDGAEILVALGKTNSGLPPFARGALRRLALDARTATSVAACAPLAAEALVADIGLTPDMAALLLPTTDRRIALLAVRNPALATDTRSALFVQFQEGGKTSLAAEVLTTQHPDTCAAALLQAVAASGRTSHFGPLAATHIAATPQLWRALVTLVPSPPLADALAQIEPARRLPEIRAFLRTQRRGAIGVELVRDQDPEDFRLWLPFAIRKAPLATLTWLLRTPLEPHAVLYRRDLTPLLRHRTPAVRLLAIEATGTLGDRLLAAPSRSRGGRPR
jgi:hypothetical protein